MIDLAGPSDADAVRRLWNEIIAETTITFTSAPKTAEQIDRLVADQPVFIARDGTRVLGFATYAQFRGGDGYRLTQEHAIYLTGDARGRGLGRGLMRAVEDHARAAGTHSLIGGISGENTDGIAFHTAIGFIHLGRLPEVGHKFGRFLDLVLMQKQL
ncbi:GNAT family N-acetyltransferase [Jannaschia sp. CCS1]|uniref:GNAT family N-acetyltransferase n=1 Tax=Jannaschia sp. (strain CCS1) TaxID=290400 RepID=UPI000053A0B2|nr:GNAT family N-acetyltransferase [Jannaschia sp. CCS1]ABD56305.1 GCN5-related N-acetyltransferase [Jannaschia sp. CCS1]